MAFIPLSDASRPASRFPPGVILLILANCAGFTLELLQGDEWITAWSVIPAEIVAGHHWITLLTSMFMHGSWLHIAGNLIFLWAFGPAIEDAMGHARFLVFYIAGGLVAMAAQVAASPHSTLPCLGASGAIAAVMGAFLVTYPRDRIKSVLFIGWYARVTFVPAALLIGVWLLLQLISLGTIADQETGGVAYMAHVGGLAFGAATARAFERY
ncbi:MAG TPA: rhomboid family intramembrane serine protease [Steroidobacteraceae bacterium]|nr:rhomboid family intramembrane serine protease [Steroidobacteraceae bacterium]